MANIDSKYDSFIHFTVKFNSRDYSISFFSGIFNSKNYSITFFPGKFDSKIDTKFKSGFIQFFIHSIRKPRYRRPLLLSDRIFLLELCSLFFSFFVCGGSSSYFPFSMTVNWIFDAFSLDWRPPTHPTYVCIAVKSNYYLIGFILWENM